MATQSTTINFNEWPQDQLIELSYVSQATHDMGMLSLMNLLDDAVHKNAEKELTGVLFYDTGIFGQILEGYPAQLAEVWHAIAADHRHDNIQILGISPITKRNFSNWAMNFYGSDEISQYVPELKVHFKEGTFSLPDEILTLMKSISNQSGEGVLQAG